jgi:hypothetical protein
LDKILSYLRRTSIYKKQEKSPLIWSANTLTELETFIIILLRLISRLVSRLYALLICILCVTILARQTKQNQDIYTSDTAKTLLSFLPYHSTSWLNHCIFTRCSLVCSPLGVKTYTVLDKFVLYAVILCAGGLHSSFIILRFYITIIIGTRA